LLWNFPTKEYFTIFKENYFVLYQLKRVRRAVVGDEIADEFLEPITSGG
jgi:hypothetical protein